jgi:hypothetical protein
MIDVVGAFWAAVRKEIKTAQDVPEPTDGYTIRSIFLLVVALLVAGVLLLLL